MPATPPGNQSALDTDEMRLYTSLLPSKPSLPTVAGKVCMCRQAGKGVAVRQAEWSKARAACTGIPALLHGMPVYPKIDEQMSIYIFK
jgi:hypothetical protein